MDIILYLVAILIALAAVALNMVSLPGNWIILIAAAALSYYHGGLYPHWGYLILILVILLAAEIVEFLGGMIGAKVCGASKTASLAAIAGAVLGGLIGIPPITFITLGLDHLAAAVAGAFLAVLIVELIQRKTLKDASKAAFGAALGRGVGIVTKIAAGLLAWLVLVITAGPW